MALPGEQPADVAGRGHLSGIRTGGVDTGVEGMHRAAESVDRERGRDIGGAGEPLGAGDRQRADRGRGLRPVDERQALLGAERDRRQAGGRERVAPGAQRRGVADPRLPLADEDERQMRERREVAARTDRSAAGHLRVDAVVQEVEQPLERRSPDAREALRQDVRPERHRRAHGPAPAAASPTPAA